MNETIYYIDGSGKIKVVSPSLTDAPPETFEVVGCQNMFVFAIKRIK